MTFIRWYWWKKSPTTTWGGGQKYCKTLFCWISAIKRIIRHQYKPAKKKNDIVHQPTTCHRVDITRNLRLSSHSLTFLLGLAQFVIQNLPTSATRLERVIRWNQNYEQEPRIQKEYGKPSPTGKYFESWNLRLRFTMCFNMVSILKRYICGWICYDSWYQSQSSNPACNSLDKATWGRRRRWIPWKLMLFPFQGDETHHSSGRKKKKHDHDLSIYCWKCSTKLYSKLKTIH